MLRTTKIAPTECPYCAGMGYTQDGADVMRTIYNQEHHAVVEVETIRKGYGCFFCQGLGQVSEADRVHGVKQLRKYETRRIS